MAIDDPSPPTSTDIPEGAPKRGATRGPRRKARVPLLIGAILLALVSLGGIAYTVVDVVRDLTHPTTQSDTLLRPGDGRFDRRADGRGGPDGSTAPSGFPERPDANGSATTGG